VAWLKSSNLFANTRASTPTPVRFQNINGAGWAPPECERRLLLSLWQIQLQPRRRVDDESIIANPLTPRSHRATRKILKQRIVCDVGRAGRCRATPNLFVSGRNASTPAKTGISSPTPEQMKEKYGGQWTAGVKGTF